MAGAPETSATMVALMALAGLATLAGLSVAFASSRRHG
jgi:LPXTG-motif cell wall-anchored protein